MRQVHKMEARPRGPFAGLRRETLGITLLEVVMAFGLVCSCIAVVGGFIINMNNASKNLADKERVLVESRALGDYVMAVPWQNLVNEGISARPPVSNATKLTFTARDVAGNYHPIPIVDSGESITFPNPVTIRIVVNHGQARSEQYVLKRRNQ